MSENSIEKISDSIALICLFAGATIVLSQFASCEKRGLEVKTMERLIEKDSITGAEAAVLFPNITQPQDTD